MKKIAILSAVNIKHMSLISLYTNIMDDLGIPYDIIYMDKYGETEHIGAKKIYRFENKIDHGWSRTKKISRHFRFLRYAKTILKENQYDFLIVWNDVAITIFGHYLSKRWKNKYCLNIRDYNGEKKWYIFRLFEKAIRNSSFTTISSEGFKSFLPKHEYISLYSYNESLLATMKPRQEKQKENEPIRISFVGSVRFFSINKQLVDVFKNDERFVLHFHGTNGTEMEKYAKSVDAKNVICSDTFPVDKTSEYLEQADIVNNVFGNGTEGVRTLTSIRLFHAAYLNMPIMVSASTYMETITRQYGIGYSVESIDAKLPDKVFSWYRSLDQTEIMNGSRALINEAEKANKLFREVVRKWII